MGGLILLPCVSHQYQPSVTTVPGADKEAGSARTDTFTGKLSCFSVCCPLSDTSYVYTYQLICIIQVTGTNSFHAKSYANYILFDYELVTLSLSL